MPRFLLIICLLTTLARAQSPTEQSLIFTGTTVVSGGDTFAYLLWQAPDHRVLLDRTLALYRKPGAVNSPDPFVIQSVINPADDKRLLASLVRKAEKVGGNSVALESQLTSLLTGQQLTETMSLADKMFALLQAALTSDKDRTRMLLLARQHPAIALAAGLAATDKIPNTGRMTYELREYNKATSTDIAVVGRITVDASAVLTLPAPGAPEEVVDVSAKGDRNVSLRWTTPAALRALAPLHYGFDLYRVPRGAALTNGWLTTPPATVAALLSVPQTKRVNSSPILPSLVLNDNPPTVPPPGTFFIIDDNDRFRPGGAQFVDGDKFVYFTAARDILGRPGVPSAGTQVTICDRFPPLPPHNLRVTNEVTYNSATKLSDQRFKIVWNAATAQDGGGISAYYVYRWRTPSEMPALALQLHAVQNKPHRQLVAILPGTQLSFMDNGTVAPPAWASPSGNTSPVAPGDLGKTYYYTVRAADDSLCANLSANSAPAWGVLRDREGPAAPLTTQTNTAGYLPELAWATFGFLDEPGVALSPARLRLACYATPAKGLDWAEFKLQLDGGETFLPLGRTNFHPDSGTGQEAVLDRTVVEYLGSRSFWCRVGSTTGMVSDWVQSRPFGAAGGPNGPPPQAGKRLVVAWQVPQFTIVQTNGTRHIVVDPNTGTTIPVTGGFLSQAGSKEFKIYRRVNDGPQSLIAQGEIPAGNPVVVWADTNPPVSGSKVCYFAQVFDEHGNPSPLLTLNSCVDMGAPSLLGVPILDPPVSAGTAANPSLKLRWYCAKPGVERFEVWIGTRTGSVPQVPGTLSADLTSHPHLVAGIPGAEGMDFSVHETPLARYSFTAPSGARGAPRTGQPEYEIEVPVSRTEDYAVMIRAVGPGGYGGRITGSFSTAQSVTWKEDSVGGVLVPWPARALPSRAAFHPGIEAKYFSITNLAPWRGVGIRIGEYSDVDRSQNTTVTPSATNPATYNLTLADLPVESHVYINDVLAPVEKGQRYPGSLLPIAVYRMQLASDRFPNAAEDLYQVSPLIEEIAQHPVAAQLIPGPEGPITIPAYRHVTDPFIACLHRFDSGLQPSVITNSHDVFVLDRQPVIKGAKYRYYIVRFSPSREIERVIATNEVTIPETP